MVGFKTQHRVFRKIRSESPPQDNGIASFYAMVFKRIIFDRGNFSRVAMENKRPAFIQIQDGFAFALLENIRNTHVDYKNQRNGEYTSQYFPTFIHYKPQAPL